MAENTTIKYVDYSALSYYDGKLKAYITSKDTEILNRSKVTITKLETATEGSVATYEVFQNYTGEGESKTLVSLGKIEIPLDKFVSAGQVTDHVFAEGETAKKAIELTVTNGDKVYIDISGIAGDIKALENRIVKLEATHATEGEGEAKTFLTVAKEIENAVKALDTTTDVTIASVAEGVVTLKAGVKEEDGIIKQGTGDDIVLAKVATTGKAENVSVEAKSGEATDTQAAWELNDADVQAALEKIVKAEANDKAAIDKLNGTVDTEGSVRKMIKDNAGSADSNVTKVDKYEEIANPGTFITVAEYNALTDDQKALYQAVDKTLTINEAIKDAKDAATEGSAVTVEKLGTAEAGYIASYAVKQAGVQVGATINIPKDYLVKSADLKTADEDIKSGEEVVVAKGHKYIDFVVNTVEGSGNESHIYLDVNTLFDDYESGSKDTDAIVVEVKDHKISASITDGTISRDKIDEDFEDDLAAIEAAIGTTGEGEAEALYSVAARIKAEAENADYTPAEGDKTTIQAAIRALEASAKDTNGAFVFKGTVTNKAALPTNAAKGDAYLTTDTKTLYICSTGAVADPATDAVYTQLAVNGTFSVGNDTLAHDVDIKAYIDSRIFVGTQEEVDTAKAAGTIDDTTFVVVTDSDSQELTPVTETEIDALFITA